MQQRIRRYISDRKTIQLYSHDLKTPITRLRLRVELLDDDTQIEKFSKDLDDLEMMVKGALQTVKDTHIHENIESIDINVLLAGMAEDYNLLEPHMTIEGHCKHLYRGKPLALKRCIANLIDNAIKYGDRARVIVMDDLEKNSKTNMLYIYVVMKVLVFLKTSWKRCLNPITDSLRIVMVMASDLVLHAASPVHMVAI